MKSKAMFAAVAMAALVALPQLAGAAAVHTLDCKDCHIPSLSVTDLGGGNVCLSCHDTTVGSFPMSDGTTGNITSAFGVNDPSNAMDPNAPVKRGTSHNWGAPDTQVAAGAQAPVNAVFYSRQGSSHTRVTCARCHNPHADDTNPQILVMGPGSGAAMCLDCHRSFNQTTELHTHPVDVTYATALTDHPDKYNVSPGEAPDTNINTDNGIKLYGGKVTCDTCHQVHFADSDPTTPDTPANWANIAADGGDGKLLRSYGRVAPTASTAGAFYNSATLSSQLCTTCHVYGTHHGSNAAIGCLDCHGGHSPTGNVYLLRSQVSGTYIPELSAVGTSGALPYTTTTADWLNGSGTGYCQGCHDIPSTVTQHNVASAGAADCSGCHSHSGGTFTQSCNGCHGYAPTTNTAGATTGYAVTTSAPIYNYLTTSGVFKDESQTPHKRHTAGGSDYAFSCNQCHYTVTNVDTAPHKNGNFQDVPFSDAGILAKTDGATPAYTTTGNGSCASVYCHSNGGPRGATPTYAATAPVWATGAGDITTCNVCHGNDAATMTARGNSAAHQAHLAKGYTCNVCHTNTASSNTVLKVQGGDHVDGQGDVLFDTAFDLNGAAAGGALGNAGNAYESINGSCVVYCHSNGQGAVKQAPDWDDATTGDCGDCHAVTAGTGLLGAHDKHLNAGFSCDVCHGTNAATGTHASHVDRVIDKPAMAVCNACHGATAGVTTGNDREPVWTNAASVDCATCHVGVLAQINSRPAPAKNSFYVVNGGHGDPTLAAGAPNCVNCHTLTVDHIDGVTDSNMLSGALTGDAFCQNCHATAKAHYGNGATGTSTDGNSCAACHEAHGEGMGSNADAMLIVGSGFTNKTLRASYWNASNTGVCQVCHDPTEVNNFNRTGNADATHFPGQLCTNCHKHTDNPAFMANANTCGDCHNAQMATKPHSSHVNKLNAASIETDLTDCVACHDGADQYTLTGSANGLHRNGSKNVAAALVYNSTDKTCTNSCHSSSVADGSWNDTANWLDCTACHGNPPTNGGGNGSAHADHITAGATCASCHVSVPTDRTHIDGTGGATDAAVLLNMAQELPDEANVAISGTWDDVNNTCSALYCHSNGQATPGYATADWDTTISSCVICHGGAGTTTTLTASHLAHIGTDPTDVNKQFGFTCDDCHVATASNNSTVISTALHTNTTRDVAVAAANGGTGTIGGDFAAGKCATTLCHGSSTPVWTTGATNGNCSACHGMAASAADGRDTNGDIANTDAQVGAHVAHLTSAKNWTADIACAQCHKTTVTNINAAGTYVAKVNAAGHLDAVTLNAADLAFDTLANSNSAATTWNGATCTTSYCHDGSKIGHGWSGTLNVPDWNTPFFNGTASHDCAFCHGYPPNPANGHPNDADCSACHLNTVATDDGFTDVSKHLNGIVETEGGDNCLDCHGAGKYRDPATSDPNHNDHTNVTTVLTGKKLSTSDFGNASYWYAISYDGSGNAVFGCGQCHPADVAVHRNSTVETKLTATGEAGIPAVNPKRNNTAAAAFNGTSCSGVYCHGDGVNDGSYANSPAWSGTAGAAGLVCSACHAATPTTAKHAKHVANTAYVAAGCANCHTAANVGTHISGAIDRADKLTTIDSGNQTCTNTCHASANGDWNAAGTLACTDCHGGSYIGGGANLPASGLHATTNAMAHDVQFLATAAETAPGTATCTSCHSATPTTAHVTGVLQTAAQTTYTFTANITSYDRAVGCAARCHDDNQATAGDAGKWMRKWLGVTDARPQATDNPGAAVCDNCHGDGISKTDGTTIDNVWNGGLVPGHGDVDGNNGVEMLGQHGQCKTCHGWGDAAYNKAWGASHGNGTLTMNGPVGTGSGYDDGTVVNAASNFGCTAACHSGSLTNAGDANFNHKLADSGWTIAYGNFGSGDCNTCHNDQGRNHSGATTESGDTHNLHTGAAHIAGACTQCHPHDGISVSPGTGVHFDNKVDFNNTKMPSSYNYAGADFGGNCSTNTCHDTDDAVEEWKNVSLGADACADCHNSGKTGIFTGLSAYPPTSNKHGLHLANTALVATCSECHGHNGTLSSIAPFTNHIDNSLAVGDQLTSYTNPTCANSCHALAGNGSGAATWLTANANPLGCNDCHNKAANTIAAPVHAGLSSTAGPATGKHGAHVGADADYLGANSCTTCHKHQGELGVTGQTAGHATGAVSYDAAVTDYVSGTKTCTNVCHVSASGDWDAAGTLACTDCHTQAAKTLGAAGSATMSASVAPATGRHTVHVNSNNYVPNNCTDCHGHSGALSKGSNGHVNGASKTVIGMASQVSSYSTLDNTCVNTCHLVVNGRDWIEGVVTNGTALACADCHNAPGKSLNQGSAWPPASFAHAGHLNSNALPNATAQNDCYACHGNTTTNAGALTGTGHLNLTAGDLSFNSAFSYQTVAITTGGAAGTTRTCSNVLCHNGVTTPTWGSGAISCGKCHNTAGTGPLPSGSTGNRHDIPSHANNDAVYTDCANCHLNAVSYTAAGGHADHQNLVINIGFPAATLPGASYSDAVAGVVTNSGAGVNYGGDFTDNGTCASVECHFNNITPAWNAAQSVYPARCVVCHNDGTAGTALKNAVPTASSAIHDKHVTNASSAYVATDCAECHGAGADTAAHSGHGQLNGVDFNAGFTYSSANQNCTNACHLAGDISDWSGTGALTCDDCHNATGKTLYVSGALTATTPPATGKHAKHDANALTTLSGGCTSCHPHAGALGSSATTKHVNGSVVTSIDIDGTKITDVDLVTAGNQTQTTAAWTSTCTNVCHSASVADDNWTGGTLECVDCHSGSYVGGNYSALGKHAQHNVTTPAAYDTAKANNSTAGVYDFNCANCHGATLTNHMNNVKNVTLADFSGGNCNNNACHNNGTAGNAAAVTANWTAGWVSDGTTDKCDNCHGNSPTSNAHALHSVGIHFDTLYDHDGNGLMATGSGVGAAHGNSTTSTTISCNTCHNTVISTAANDKNAACASCHNGTTATLRGDATISNKALHVNESPNVAFASLTGFKSKAQLRNDIGTVPALTNSWTRTNGYKSAVGDSFDAAKALAPGYSAGSCSSIACHNGINTPTWTSGSAGNCAACHTTLPQ